jgi:uncharacterized protein YhbP (UPF0306 family)
MSGDTAARIAAFLDAHHVMSLATCGPDGPHAANLFYGRDALALLWVSDPRTRHSMELETNPRVAATVAPDYCDFDEICGVQISGDAHRVAHASERHLTRTLLEARYPSLKRLFDRPTVKQAYETAELYRLVPRRMVIIDNKRGFGHKDTLEFEAFDARRTAPDP